MENYDAVLMWKNKVAVKLNRYLRIGALSSLPRGALGFVLFIFWHIYECGKSISQLPFSNSIALTLLRICLLFHLFTGKETSKSNVTLVRQARYSSYRNQSKNKMRRTIDSVKNQEKKILQQVVSFPETRINAHATHSSPLFSVYIKNIIH